MSHAMQQALAQSRAEHDDGQDAVAALVAAGRFVVVAALVAYCPRTDAAMGNRFAIVSDHATRDEAEEALERVLDATDGGDPEEVLAVWPRLPFAPLLEVDLYAEDIPF